MHNLLMGGVTTSPASLQPELSSNRKRWVILCILRQGCFLEKIWRECWPWTAWSLRQIPLLLRDGIIYYATFLEHDLPNNKLLLFVHAETELNVTCETYQCNRIELAYRLKSYLEQQRLVWYSLSLGFTIWLHLTAFHIGFANRPVLS